MIGNVLINLHPLLSATVEKISGWYPIFDSLRGLRGEVHLTVKLEVKKAEPHFQIQVSGCEVVPLEENKLVYVDLVDELESDDDPEYHLVDNFRTKRSSNEARRLIFHRMAK